MAATRGAKNPTSGNDTPDTPDVNESAIAAMKVDELRRTLKNRGVKGTAELKRPELVRKLIQLETTGAGSARPARKSPSVATTTGSPTSAGASGSPPSTSVA